MRFIAIPFILAFALLGGCTPTTPTHTQSPLPPIVSSTPSPAPSSTNTPKPTETPLPSHTPTITTSPTESLTPTATLIPSSTLSPTPSLTPTPDYPDVVVREQANCRYGPGVAYLYRWGLYAGDPAEVHGRNGTGTWYWIKPANLDSHCWASEIVFEERIDIQQVPVVQARLPRTTFAGPPGNVRADRDGSQVTVAWDKVDLSDDKRRGYMLEATLCQNGALFWQAYRTDETSFTFTDEEGCSGESGALLYTAEKHGYSDPVTIPWP